MSHTHNWKAIGNYSGGNNGAMCKVHECRVELDYEEVDRRLNTYTELLEALQTLIEDIEYHGHGREMNKHLDKCRSIIANASPPETS